MPKGRLTLVGPKKTELSSEEDEGEESEIDELDSSEDEAKSKKLWLGKRKSTTTMVTMYKDEQELITEVALDDEPFW